MEVQRRGIRRFPPWSVRLRCIYARRPPPPGGTAPKLPSRACKASSALVGKAYAASGQAASALHAMAVLQVYQAKVLSELHEGVPKPELLQDLRSATDYALRATKVTAQALGRAMSTMMVQEHHLWLNLVEMKDAEKVRFLDAPISQAGLFGDTVEEFAQQFSAVKKQTEAIKHILPRRAPAPGPAPPKQQPPPVSRRGLFPDRLRARHRLVLHLNQPCGRALARSPEERDLLTCLDPHSARGRVWVSAPPRLSASRQTATTWSIKEQFSSLGEKIYVTASLRGTQPLKHVKACSTASPALLHALTNQAHPSVDPLSSGDLRMDPCLSVSMVNAPMAGSLRGTQPPEHIKACSTAGPALRHALTNQVHPSVDPLSSGDLLMDSCLSVPMVDPSMAGSLRGTQPPKHIKACSTAKLALLHTLTEKQAHPSVDPLSSGDLLTDPCMSVMAIKAPCVLRDSTPPNKGLSPQLSHTVPTRGTLVVPLRPLAENFTAWLEIPNLSRWLLRTIRLGYAIQFARNPPKFSGIFSTTVRDENAAVLRAEIATLLAKDAIEPVPSADMKKGFYSPYFIVPKKGGGLRPILDLRILNRALHKLPFRMLTLKCILTCIRFQDWFVAINLKDAYFHVSILPRHRPFLRFAFEGRAFQYKVLPFGLSLSPRVFTKVAEAALAPLRERGIWGHMASAAAITPLGLMHMRPLQHWLRSRVPRWPWRQGSYRVHVTPVCLKTLGPWKDISFLRAGVPLGQVSRRILVTTDASNTGWGAVCNGQAAAGLWSGPRLHWHINCLELLTVFLALKRFRPLVQGKHMLVRIDSTATVAYINHQGGVRSFRILRFGASGDFTLRRFS
ncbi:hypothetical protein QQF64_029611 [Cirrhinus molitorella]|uniref:ribonuclease H n=1 Tax=Cirrhinus molitorella TaxID=172907 RepID=A0ABR3N1B2_9TELE